MNEMWEPTYRYTSVMNMFVQIFGFCASIYFDPVNFNDAILK